MSARIVGRIDVHPRGFGFIRDDAGKTAFVSPPDLNAFLDGDIVEADLETTDDGRSTARRPKLTSRSRETLFGRVVSHGKRKFLQIDRTVANTDWPFQGDLAASLADGAFVVARIVAATPPALTIERVLDADEDPGLMRCLVRHGVRAEFPAAVRESAEKLAKHRDFGARRDLRELPTITIDAPYSRDLDDALAVLPATPDGALRVLVSIADVDAFVEEGSDVDLEARARGTSVYLADRVVPMLPEVLCDQAISLLEGQERPALTVELRIDPEGHVTSYDVEPTLIRSHARLSYAAVSEFFERGHSAGVPIAVEQTLRWLRTAAGRLSAARAARGGIEVSREEASVRLDAATHEPLTMETRADTAAHRLVERLMVAANEAVASWLVARGLPGVFRVHAAPTEERVRRLSTFAHNFGIEAAFGPTMTPRALAAFEAQLRGTPIADAVRSVLTRTLGPATYQVTPGLHFGLAAPLYLHFTSPIRRYADLAVHRIIKRHLRGARDQVAGDADVQALAETLQRCSTKAARAESERSRMLVARLAANHLEERLVGRIVGVQSFGLLVTLLERRESARDPHAGDHAVSTRQTALAGASGTLALDALPNGPHELDLAAQCVRKRSSGETRWTVGDEVDVRVISASEELGRIELGLDA